MRTHETQERSRRKAPANREGVIREEKYRQQKDRVMTTGDCMNKNTDPVFIQEIQRMDPCAAHTSRTLQPTRRPRRSTESSGHLDRLLYRGVSQGGVTLSLTLLSSCLLVSPLAPTSPPLLLTFASHTAIVRGLASATSLICGHLH